nr:MAG TPA: hypothetical protein [Caudoviricetes sp.]
MKISFTKRPTPLVGDDIVRPERVGYRLHDTTNSSQL